MRAPIFSTTLALAFCMTVTGCDRGPSLKTATDAELGYSVQVPAEATLRKTVFRHIWAWTYDNGKSSYTVQVSDDDPIVDVAAAKARVAKQRAADNIAGAKAVENGFLVTMKADDMVHTREVWLFRNGKTKTLLAICEGLEESILERMCGSLRVSD